MEGNRASATEAVLRVHGLRPRWWLRNFTRSALARVDPCGDVRLCFVVSPWMSSHERKMSNGNHKGQIHCQYLFIIEIREVQSAHSNPVYEKKNALPPASLLISFW